MFSWLQALDPISPSLSDESDSESMARYQTFAGEVALISRRHKFATMDAFVSFVETAQISGFYVHAARANIVASFTALRGVAPFSAVVRFPETEYIDLDHPGVRNYLDQLINACELPDRAQNVGGNNNGHSSNADAKRAFDTALQHLRNIAKCVREEELVKYGVFTQATFEAAYNLLWQHN
uniref:Putative coat protein n=3 Tax=Atrato Virga-like virus 2 TaxID=2689341 RepID=A0A6B9KP24_9VIRU